MYKNNSRDSIKFKGCSSFQLSCNLTGKCHAIGYYSYTKRYRAYKKININESTTNNLSPIIYYSQFLPD